MDYYKTMEKQRLYPLFSAAGRAGKARNRQSELKGEGMSRNKHALQVLAILSENLVNPQPQLVPTATIAGRMKIAPGQLGPLLRTMEGMGVIQSDPDLRYHLITAEGLRWLREREPTGTAYSASTSFFSTQVPRSA